MPRATKEDLERLKVRDAIEGREALIKHLRSEIEELEEARKLIEK
jgi:hypothetical protein